MKGAACFDGIALARALSRLRAWALALAALLPKVRRYIGTLEGEETVARSGALLGGHARRTGGPPRP